MACEQKHLRLGSQGCQGVLPLALLIGAMKFTIKHPEVLNLKILRVCAKMCISPHDTKHCHLGATFSFIAILLDFQTKIFQNQMRGRCPCDPLFHSHLGLLYNQKFSH